MQHGREDTAEMEEERCYRCSAPAATERGVIYVRREIERRWRSVVICKDCWNIEMPERRIT